MKRRRLGSEGPEVPVVGLGTWNMERDPTAAVRALRAGFEAGMTHVDTAEMYGQGRVEEIVGEALRGRRDEVVLVSKVLPHNASRRGTVAACERSLRRLGTDHLDVYLLHWKGSHPLAETLAAFEELRERGMIRHYGVSNFDAEEVAEAVAIAGPGRIVCNQVLYHLDERAIEHRVVPECERLGVAIVAYSPFGSGAFPDGGAAGGKALAQVAREHGATPRQAALAFLTRRESVSTIPKSADVDHVLENAGAGDLALDEADVRRIDAAFPLPPARPGVPMI